MVNHKRIFWYREIVFRSTSQIAGARTVNRLSVPFSDVRKKKGLRISADPSSLMRKIGLLLSFCRGALARAVFSVFSRRQETVSSPLYFRRVAMPPRMCRWALFSSSTALTWR